MTYLSELRASLVDAAHRQHASAEHASAEHASAEYASAEHACAQHAPAARGERERASTRALWRRSLHGGRAILASFALGLTGTAVGAIQVGAPLGPEPQLSPALTRTVSPPPSVKPSP
ncbi:MAG: hypothetical protein ABSB69_11115 [Solirubrobacteraceae bacterium]|jgi:hypothetical protein